MRLSFLRPIPFFGSLLIAMIAAPATASAADCSATGAQFAALAPKRFPISQALQIQMMRKIREFHGSSAELPAHFRPSLRKIEAAAEEKRDLLARITGVEVKVEYELHPYEPYLVVKFRGPQKESDAWLQYRKLRVPIVGYGVRSKMNPYGDPYVQRDFTKYTARAMKFHEAIERALADLEMVNRNDTNALNRFGLRENTALGGVDSPAALAALLRANANYSGRPVKLFRGMFLPDDQSARNMAADGILPKNHSPAEMAEAVNRFVGMSAVERQKFMLGVVSRQRGDDTLFVGASADPRIAQGYGNYVFELEVPENALVRNTGMENPMYNTEKEEFVPFFVQPEWIKRVIRHDGGVVFGPGGDRK